LNQQASLLSHFDCFTGLIVPAFASLVLALTIKNFRRPESQPVHFEATLGDIS
jgi:hypothetical protein